MIKFKIRNFLLVVSGCWLVVVGSCFAQGEDLAKLKENYLKDHRYCEFVDYLKNQKGGAEVAYYVTLTRYEQLKYLEETQKWDEYFSKGNNYRDDIVSKAQEAINLTTSKDKINLLARCILWQFHKDQQDVFEEKAREDLVNAVKEYAQAGADIALIKYIADKLASYSENISSRELYDIYVKKLITPETKDEVLVQVAQETYLQGNIPLSTLIYDAYIDRIIKTYPKEQLISTLLSIAKRFTYKDKEPCQPLYAEKVFAKVEEIAGTQAFDEPTMYLRAWNLEKFHTYSDAKEKYLTLLDRFPKTTYHDEAIYKCGIIATYVLRDPGAGVEYFERLAKSPNVTAQVISSIYQLGLLAQWGKNFDKAKEHYNRLISLAGENYSETVALAKERLKELDGTGEIEYNLRTFLDVSLKEEYGAYDMSKVDLKSSPYKLIKEERTDITASTYLPESGCMAIEVNYLWSGHLGKASPSTSQPEFATSYIHPGTKEINVVVVSPSGILDRRVDMVDDYSQ